jgi:hypothetical protein
VKIAWEWANTLPIQMTVMTIYASWLVAITIAKVLFKNVIVASLINLKCRSED